MAMPHMQRTRMQQSSSRNHIRDSHYPREFLYVIPADRWPYMFCAFDNLAVRKKEMMRGGALVTLQPYVLAPVRSRPGDDGNRLGINHPSTQHTAWRRTGSGQMLDVLPRPGTRAVKQRICDAAAAASAQFNQLKLRVTFGKEIFYDTYSAARSSAALQRQYNTLQELRQCEVSYKGHIAARFSDFLPSGQAASDSMLAVAEGPLIGLRAGEERMHVSVQLKDVRGGSGTPLEWVTISLRVDPVAGICTVHKVKSMAVKPLVVNFLNPKTAGADFRFEVVCQNILRDPSAEPQSSDSDALSAAEEAWRYARGLTWSQTEQAVVPPAGDHRFVVDTKSTRTKTKRGYEGQFAGYAMRLTSARIHDEDGNNMGLGVSCPEINTALRSLEGASAEALEALVAVCDMLADAS